MRRAAQDCATVARPALKLADSRAEQRPTEKARIANGPSLNDGVERGVARAGSPAVERIPAVTQGQRTPTEPMALLRAQHTGEPPTRGAPLDAFRLLRALVLEPVLDVLELGLHVLHLLFDVGLNVLDLLLDLSLEFLGVLGPAAVEPLGSHA